MSCWLKRTEAAQFLSQQGYRVAVSSLCTMATNGTGPPYRRFGKRAMYHTDDLMAWLEERSTPLSARAQDHTNHLNPTFINTHEELDL